MKTLFLLLVCFISLFSKDLNATYKVSFGIFGKIGIAKTSLHVEGGKYKISVHAKSTGFAAFVSGDREEWYKSEGFVKNGVLIPKIYTKIIQKRVSIGDVFKNRQKRVMKRYILTYTFNHKAKKVIAKRVKMLGAKRSEKSEQTKFYAQNDLLSLFFNFKNIFPTLDIKKHHILHALGANKKTGKIDIFPLSKKEFSRLMKGNLDNLKFMKVILSDKIFASKKGELYVGLDKDGLCKKAVLKDVIFFGDIRGELIEKNY